MKKEREVKRAIKPLCKSFKIKYEYVDVLPLKEILILDGQKILCTGNSVEQIRDKVIGYIFAEIYCRNNTIGVFKTQTLNAIKKDWIK